VAMIGGILGREDVGRAAAEIQAAVRAAWTPHSRDDSYAGGTRAVDHPQVGC